ncbi:MAG: SpoIIE family protein phosphatase, partial [Spirochaetales bacterium]|nr:SpoIIE family protein phosphatase [Spirochaetales bacterium]
NVAEGDFTTCMEIDSKDEFGLLSENFNSFMGRMQQKIESELEFIREVGNNIIGSDKDLENILKTIVRSSVNNTDANGGFFLSAENGEVKKTLIGGFSRESEDIIFAYKKVMEENIAFLNTIIKSGEMVFIKNTDNRNEIKGVSSFIAVPVNVSGIFSGMLMIYKKGGNNYFSDIDFTHLKSFADYAVITIDNVYKYIEILEKREIEKDISIAADIQKNLLPVEVPLINGLEFGIMSEPAKGVTGDYYDIIQLADNRTAFVMCDVAGKGISAALIMVMIRSVLHLMVVSAQGPALLLSLINRSIFNNVSDGKYATMQIVIFNNRTREAVYANAAHLPLLIYKDSRKRMFTVDTNGMPVGVDENAEYEQKKFILDKDDLFVLCTDGIAEARDRDGREYSIES